jgi:nucleotide-binding universal stress UspA family protein
LAPRGQPARPTADGGIGDAPHSRSAGKRGNMSENQVTEWDGAMYKKILVPIDLADPDLAKPAVATALMMAGPSEGMIRFVNVLPLTPVMLAEYVPPDFEVQQRKAAEDALAIVVKETGLPSARVSSTVRQGGIYQEILEEANSMQPDLIVMSSHRPQRHAVRTYFLGSNAGHVVRYAKCSVLVVRN